MSEEKLKRKLVAIVHADVVGYSRLSGSDEERTHRALSAALAQVRERVAGHGGRVVNTAGDAFLAEFGTATDALLCAVEIQQRLHEDEACHRLMVGRGRERLKRFSWTTTAKEYRELYREIAGRPDRPSLAPQRALA